MAYSKNLIHHLSEKIALKLKSKILSCLIYSYVFEITITLKYDGVVLLVLLDLDTALAFALPLDLTEEQSKYWWSFFVLLCSHLRPFKNGCWQIAVLGTYLVLSSSRQRSNHLISVPSYQLPDWFSTVKSQQSHLFNPADPIQNGWITKKEPLSTKIEAVTTIYYRPSLWVRQLQANL